MAYDPRNLGVIGYANGFTLWRYSTVDGPSEVMSYGYFNDASSLVREGDQIHIQAAKAHGLLAVAFSDRSVVVDGLTAQFIMDVL